MILLFRICKLRVERSGLGYSGLLDRGEVALTRDMMILLLMI